MWDAAWSVGFFETQKHRATEKSVEVATRRQTVETLRARLAVAYVSVTRSVSEVAGEWCSTAFRCRYTANAFCIC